MSAAIGCELVSRNGHRFKQWPQLAEEIAHAVRAFSCVLDGEICCLDADGRTNFKKLLFRREWPHLYAFDVLSIDGEDLTGLPLLERKRRLLPIMPIVDSRLLCLDHIHVRGSDLFRAACQLDLEGIVGKWAQGAYRTDGRATSWLKIKNPGYTQIRDFHELFNTPDGLHRRTFRPDLILR